MFKSSRNYLLLSLIFVFSFVYRVLLMLRETFPPGADIGLHNSIIYSITQSGNTNFLWNYFHMGGGTSLTFPGYHIVVSYVMLLTGMPDYVAHALVVSLFSSAIVLVAFLLTRKIWNETAAIVVAFLVAVSRFDIEMLMWGGYPNVITLLLIPLAFYLFLKRDQLSPAAFLAVTSLVCASIFVTHSLSALMFVAITSITILCGVALAGKTGTRRTSLLVWFLPLVLGAVIISPFLVQVVPTYLSASAETLTAGVTDIRLALLSTKVLPLEIVLPLFLVVILYFLFSRGYKGKYLTVPTLLLVLWTLVPTLLTQGYLVGLYTDYNRFMYFVILPVIMMIGLAIDHGAWFFTQVVERAVAFVRETPRVRVSSNKTLRRLLPHLTRRNIMAGFALGFLLYAFLAVPIFATPPEGVKVQTFYQVMDNPAFEAMQWARQNTPADSVFVTDALYGWWFSGFAQRKTISAVDPQYLTVTREFEPAKVATNLLDTDYLIDNGLIQIREDGGYVGRHNPSFLVKLNTTYFPYPFFHLSSEEATLTFRNAGNVSVVDMSTVQVRSMRLENGSDSASVYVAKGNDLFNFTQKVTVYEGRQFANVSVKVESFNPDVSFDTLRFIFHTRGFVVMDENFTSVAFVDAYMKVAGQLVFTEEQPKTTVLTEENQAGLELLYNAKGKSSDELNFYVGLYRYDFNPDLRLTSKEQRADFQKMVANHTETYLDVLPHGQLDVFDYRQAIADMGIDYVVLRNSEALPRFARDPMFSLVFINDEVAILQVLKNLS
ncbi:MAG: hypothetical protein ACE14S_06735 [Candidatus Bathyarchaeia archaeon]